jgi:hypothetical protein
MSFFDDSCGMPHDIICWFVFTQLRVVLLARVRVCLGRAVETHHGEEVGEDVGVAADHIVGAAAQPNEALELLALSAAHNVHHLCSIPKEKSVSSTFK